VFAFLCRLCAGTVVGVCTLREDADVLAYLGAVLPTEGHHRRCCEITRNERKTAFPSMHTSLFLGTLRSQFKHLVTFELVLYICLRTELFESYVIAI
jgi:hypothetical protein